MPGLGAPLLQGGVRQLAGHKGAPAIWRQPDIPFCLLLAIA